MAGGKWPNSVRIERHSPDCPKCGTGTLSRLTPRANAFMCIDCFELFKFRDGGFVRMNCVERKKWASTN
jgi:ribosomal protein S27AE